MITLLLSLIHYGVLLIFGVLVSYSFAGINLRKHAWHIISLCIILIIVQALSFTFLGYKPTTRLYPFISHLPLVLVLMLHGRRTLLSAAYCVSSAYLCCQLSNWLGMLMLLIHDEQWLYYAVHILSSVIIGTFLVIKISPVISSILSKPPKTLWIFAMLPFTYYLFDYATVIYSNLLYSGSKIAYEFLPFIFSIAYLIFSVMYFQEYEQKSQLEQHHHIMEIQVSQSIKEIESIRRSAYETALLRHDMHHFLDNILTYTENGNLEAACRAIKDTMDFVDSTAVTRFSSNELVNSVLSYYKNMMDQQDIRFEMSVSIPQVLPCPELSFTSILANGLENAVHAVAGLSPAKRVVILDLKTNGGKLLLSIKNPCLPVQNWSDGVPQSTREGHGLGTQSIKYTAKKLNGNCQFTESDGYFMLRVIL